MHMACAVEAAVEGGEAGEAAAKAAAAGTEEVTFLYRLTPGGPGEGIHAEGSRGAGRDSGVGPGGTATQLLYRLTQGGARGRDGGWGAGRGR